MIGIKTFFPSITFLGSLFLQRLKKTLVSISWQDFFLKKYWKFFLINEIERWWMTRMKKDSILVAVVVLTATTWHQLASCSPKINFHTFFHPLNKLFCWLSTISFNLVNESSWKRETFLFRLSENVSINIWINTRKKAASIYNLRQAFCKLWFQDTRRKMIAHIQKCTEEEEMQNQLLIEGA